MTYVLALAMVVLIVAAQWFFTSRALRSPSHFIAWVSGGYAAKIALLALGLYVPSSLGVNVRHDRGHYRLLQRGDGPHDAPPHDERRSPTRGRVAPARAAPRLGV